MSSSCESPASDADERLLRMGAFSRRCRLPVSTLHYYHDIGLLVPSSVDPRTGYRYYHPDQLETAALIAALRSIGLHPDQMRLLLEAGRTAHGDAWRSIRTSLADVVESSTQRLRRFDELMQHATDEPVLSSVQVAKSCFRWTHNTTVTAASEDLERVVRRGLASLRSSATGRPALAATFPVDLDSDPIIVELHCMAAEPRSRADDLPVLTVTYRGRHDQLWTGYRTLLDTAERHGHTIAGHLTERYGPTIDGQPTTELLLHLETDRS